MRSAPQHLAERSRLPRAALLAGALLLAIGGMVHAATVYRWIDADGTLHLSSEKPPAGVEFERINVVSAPSRPAGRAPAGAGSAKAAPAVSAAQMAERSEVLSSLQNRECVIALEALERKTSASEPTSAAELRRLQQTADANCSSNPARRREQEDMAARLRVANGTTCVEARSRLGEMLETTGGRSQGDVRAQQQFVDDYCTPPVR